MAIVLALVIVGWLVAFALGAQTGFSNTSDAVDKTPSANFSTSQNSMSQEQASAA